MLTDRPDRGQYGVPWVSRELGSRQQEAVWQIMYFQKYLQQYFQPYKLFQNLSTFYYGLGLLPLPLNFSDEQSMWQRWHWWLPILDHKGNMASIWLCLLRCSPLQSSHHVVRKPRPCGEVVGRCSSPQPSLGLSQQPASTTRSMSKQAFRLSQT